MKHLLPKFTAAVAVVALLGSCATFGALFGGEDPDLHEIRQELGTMRAAIEPILDELVALEDDPELLADYQDLKEAADAVGAAFDAYLAATDGGDATSLSDTLYGVLDAAEVLVPLLLDDADPDERMQVTLLLGLVRVMVVHAADELGDEDLEAEATAALPSAA